MQEASDGKFIKRLAASNCQASQEPSPLASAFFHGPELIQTQLGRTLLVAWSLFWVIRAVNQLVFWGVNVKSIILTLIFILVAAINLIPVFKRG